MLRRIVSLCLFAAALAAVGCTHRTERGVFYTAGNWQMPPAYHGNYFAPGGQGVDTCYVYEPMFIYEPRSAQYIGRLGERYEESPDHKILTVHLRHPVLWQDGTPFTSRDVACTWNILWLTGQDVYQDLSDIECPDDDTVIFHWSNPSALNTIHALTRWITASRHRFGQWADEAPALRGADQPEKKRELREAIFHYHPSRPIGTGPFQVSKVTASDIVLDAFPQHYDAATLRISKVRIQRWGQNAVVWSYLLAGQVDAVTPACPYDVVQEILSRNHHLQIIAPSDMSDFGIVFNSSHGATANVAFRRAVAHILDRDMIRQLAYYYGATSDGYTLGVPRVFRDRWLSPGLLGGLTRFTCDPPKAENELLAAGYRHVEHHWLQPDGTPIPILRIMAPAGSNDEVLMAEAATAQLSHFGIALQIVVVPEDLYASRLAGQDFDMAAVNGTQMQAMAHPSMAFGRFFDEGGQIQTACGLPRTFTRDGRAIDTAALSKELAHLLDERRERQIDDDLAWVVNEQVPYVSCYEKNIMIFVADGPRVTGWPARDAEIWEAAPGGVEMLYATMMAKGMVQPAP